MLRTLLKVFLCLLCVASLVILAGAFLLHQAQNAAQATPQPLSLADLIETGPGANAYVELSGVTFGKPVVEARGGVWLTIWVPMYAEQPPAQDSSSPVAVLRLTGVADQAALDQILQEGTATGLVAQRMPSPSPWNAVLPAAFLKNYPKLDPNSVTLLVQPEVKLLDWSFGPEVVFSSTPLIAAWILGGVLLLVGAGGLLLIGRSDSVPDTPARQPTVEETNRLAQETPLSCHEFASAVFFPRMLIGGGLMVLIVILGVALIGVGLLAFKQEPQAAYLVMGVGAIIALMALALGYQIKQWRAQAVAEIDVCPSGLRWRKNGGDPVQAALWSELADVHRVNFTVYQGLMTKPKDEVTIRLRSGEKLVLSKYVLTNYPLFAELVIEGSKQTPSFKVSNTSGSFLPTVGNITGPR